MNLSDQSALDAEPPTWLTRFFLVLTALWVVAQGHLGTFLGNWSNEGSLPGNLCWLLILYCIGRLLLDWGVITVKLREFSRESLFFLFSLLVLELMWQAMGLRTGVTTMAGLAAFFIQPIIVLLGFAVLHRRRVAG